MIVYVSERYFHPFILLLNVGTYLPNQNLQYLEAHMYPLC